MPDKDYSETRRQRCLSKREVVRNYLLKNPCIDCGETDPIVLQFDHVYGDKKVNISSMIYRNYSMNSLIEEMAKCEVRCANCHLRKTARDFDWYKNIG